MDKLRDYLNSLSGLDRNVFAQRCGTTVGYLRKVLSVRPKVDVALCINIERESGGLVWCEDIRPDVDWGYIRGSACREAA